MSNNKRLERNLHNKVLGGVCSGLGDYFGIDPAFWRVVFFFLFLMGCLGLPIYIILWIVMPAKTNYDTVEADQALGDTSAAAQKNKGNMTAGLTLIAVGVICLVTRYIPAINWRTAWPIALIVLGLFLIIPLKGKNHEK